MFLYGIVKTDAEGMAEFMTITPGYYVTRSAQTNVTNSPSHSQTSVQHVGQLFCAAGIPTSGNTVNPIDVITTLTVHTSVRAAATTVDRVDGYTAAAGV